MSNERLKMWSEHVWKAFTLYSKLSKIGFITAFGISKRMADQLLKKQVTYDNHFAAAVAFQFLICKKNPNGSSEEQCFASRYQPVWVQMNGSLNERKRGNPPPLHLLRKVRFQGREGNSVRQIELWSSRNALPADRGPMRLHWVFKSRWNGTSLTSLKWCLMRRKLYILT